MFKGIWRSVLKGWRSLLGTTPQKALTAAADLPPLTDPDYEYLFMQLLEGVSHGWQQPRAIEFFRKIKQRAPKSRWLEWLNTFGNQAVNANAPNEELARRMIQLSDLDCGEVTSLAGEYGHQILGKIYGSVNDEYLAEFSVEDLAGLGLANDFDSEEMELPLDLPELEPQNVAQHESPQPLPIASPDNWVAESAVNMPTPIPTKAPTDDLVLPEPLYKSRNPLEGLVDSEDDFPTFGEVPADLRLGGNKKRVTPPPPPSGFLQPITLDDGGTSNWEQSFSNANAAQTPIPEEPIEQQEITIEEFAKMLQSDPELLKDISKQLGIETTDPQVVVDTVIAQMQQQIANGQT
jgi:hypothetical protein